MKDRNMENEKDNKCWYDEIIRRHPMLYTGVNRPITENLLPFGFECGKGWNYLLEKLSNKIEALNIIYYPRFKTKVVATQVKEKYSTLRFYFDVEVDDKNFFKRHLRNFADFISLKLCSINYRMDKKVVKEPYDEVKETQLKDKVEYVEKKHRYNNCSNVEVYEKDGKYFEKMTISHYREFEYFPTRHKFLYWINQHIVTTIINYLRFIAYSKVSREQSIIRSFLYEQTCEYVKQAEQESENTCEYCGVTIGTNYSPRCETVGWITGLCDKCAEKSGNEYYKNGSLWQGNKQLKSKEEIDKERKEIEEKYKERQKAYLEEEEKDQKGLTVAKAELSSNV